MSEQSDKLTIWVANNRGKITEIAQSLKPPCSPQFVRMVLRGERHSKFGKVERLLRQAGAPVK